jgi:cyclopropane fatty-acyl-phospholipid synthase-like methyltransferase
MSVGSLARKLLGRRLFPVIARGYRAVFVDMVKVADSFPAVSPGTRVLDIGGGDGELLNILLARHPELRVTMIDLNSTLGTALRPEFRDRVEVLPRTSIRQLAALGRPPPQVIIISDVVHHIPVEYRVSFFEDVRDLLAGHTAMLVVKDVEPGTFRAQLSWLADRYVSGDRNVHLIGARELEALLGRIFPGARCEPTDLVKRDSPNYCLHVTVPGAPARQAASSGSAPAP